MIGVPTTLQNDTAFGALSVKLQKQSDALVLGEPTTRIAAHHHTPRILSLTTIRSRTTRCRGVSRPHSSTDPPIDAMNSRS